MKLAHWPLMGALPHFAQRRGDWEVPQPAQAPPHCTVRQISYEFALTFKYGPMLYRFRDIKRRIKSRYKEDCTTHGTQADHSMRTIFRKAVQNSRGSSISKKALRWTVFKTSTIDYCRRKTRSPADADKWRDASSLSVVSFNSKISRAQSSIISRTSDLPLRKINYVLFSFLLFGVFTDAWRSLP